MRPVAVEPFGLLMSCKAVPKSFSRRPLEWGGAGILPPSWSDATWQPISQLQAQTAVAGSITSP